MWGAGRSRAATQRVLDTECWMPAPCAKRPARSRTPPAPGNPLVPQKGAAAPAKGRAGPEPFREQAAQTTTSFSGKLLHPCQLPLLLPCPRCPLSFYCPWCAPGNHERLKSSRALGREKAGVVAWEKATWGRGGDAGNCPHLRNPSYAWRETKVQQLPGATARLSHQQPPLTPPGTGTGLPPPRGTSLPAPPERWEAPTSLTAPRPNTPFGRPPLPVVAPPGRVTTPGHVFVTRGHLRGTQGGPSVGGDRPPPRRGTGGLRSPAWVV